MKELEYEIICEKLNHKLDILKGLNYNEDRFGNLEKYKDYVLYTIQEESGLKEVLDTYFMKYWDDEIMDRSISFSEYYWSDFNNYITELKDYFQQLSNQSNDMTDEDIRVLRDFYKSERRKDIITEVLNNMRN